MIEIRNLIHDLGETHTVILSSHILSEVQTICDRVLIIAHGKVAAQGTPEELAAQLAARGMIAATALGTKEQILAAAAKVEGLTDLRVTAEKGDEVSLYRHQHRRCRPARGPVQGAGRSWLPGCVPDKRYDEFGGYLPTDHRDCTGESPAGRNRRTGSGSGCRTAGTVC
mgnify:CR=1 FL=1